MTVTALPAHAAESNASDALMRVRINGVAPFGSSSAAESAAVILDQTHALLLALRVGHLDSAELMDDHGAEGSGVTLRPEIRASALEGIGTLVALSRLLIEDVRHD